MSEENLENDPQSQTEEREITLNKADYDAQQQRLRELESMKEQLLRSAADFENAKKRLTRERDEFAKFSQESILKDLLPVLDNFDRALTHADSLGESEKKLIKSVLTGIQMVQKQMQEILKNHGLAKVESLGKSFDPHKHEAVGTVDSDRPADEVVEECEAGYLLHDRLVRAAKVKISSGKDKTTEDHN